MKRTIALLSIVLMISSITLAQNRQSNNRNGDRLAMNGSERMNKIERLATMLELTDDQRSQIEVIHLESMKSTKSVKNLIGEKEARLKTLSTNDSPDNKQILKIAREIGDLRTEIFVNKIQTKQKVRALLDEKQKLKFDMFQEKRGMGGRHGKRHGFQGRGNKG